MTSKESEGNSCFGLNTRSRPNDESSKIQILSSCFSLKAEDGYLSNAAQAKYEPTYRMQPNKKLTGSLMKELITSVMEENLAEDDGFLKQEYSATNAGKFCKSLTDLIKNRLSELNYERYKCVVQVVCTPCMGQSLDLASRMLLDTRWDDYATVEIKPNNSMKLFIHAYSIYAE